MAAVDENEFYTRKKDNDLTLGPVFEDLVAMNLFLTLEEDEAMAREFNDLNKFDDVVIRVQKGEKHEYYFRQLKHKDTEKNSDQCITWNDLLTSDRKNAFNLKEYFESYLHICKTNGKLVDQIKELSIMTTTGFGSTQEKNRTITRDLYQIARDLENQSKKPHGPKPMKPIIKTKFYITEEDIEHYFVKCLQKVGKISGNRYKFSESGIREVSKILYSPSIAQNRGIFENFLKILAFDVNQPHIIKLKEINHSILKLYFPFYWDSNTQEKRFDQIRHRIIELFKPIQGNLARWATVNHRKNIFSDLTVEFKRDVALGSKTNYEDSFLKPMYEKLSFENRDQLEEMLPWTSNFSKILNVHSKNSNPTVIALKLFKATVKLKAENQTLFIRAENKEAIEKISEYFERLKNDVRNYFHLRTAQFTLVIEVSACQSTNPTKGITQNIDSLLAKLSKFTSMIGFILVTRTPIKDKLMVECVEGTPLEWQHLSDAAKLFLLDKELFIENCFSMSTTLKALGFSESSDGIDSSTLADLIIHDKYSPLNVRLQRMYSDIPTNYILRMLQPQDDSKEIKEIELLDGTFEEKFFIVTDLPGKGKRTLLNSLANHFENTERKKEKNIHVLFRLNLLECRKKYWKEDLGIDNTVKALDFLVENLLNIDKSNALCVFILKQLCLNSSASIYLLIDNFDDLGDSQRSTTLTVMKHFEGAEGIKRIILISRPGNKPEIENKLKAKFFHLRMFSKENQVKFLTKCWENNFQDLNDLKNQTKVKKFAQALVDYAHKSKDISGKAFFESPLQCMIVSKCFQKQLKNYLHENATDELLKFDSAKFQLHHFYQQFYEKKVDNLLKKQLRLVEENDASDLVKSQMMQALSDAIVRLSIISLMGVEELQVLCRLNQEFYQKTMFNDDLKRAEMLGIIDEQRNKSEPPSNLGPSSVRFIHPTFAEYFFAKFLVGSFTEIKSELLDNDLKHEVLKERFRVITLRILTDEKLAGIKQFFDLMIGDYIPSADEERCPFAIEKRSEVIRKWPAIGHEKFNDFIADLIIKKHSEILSFFGKIGKTEIQFMYAVFLCLLKRTEPININFNLLTEAAVETASITVMMMYCVKEYASRPDIPYRKKENIAEMLVLILERWFNLGYRDSKDGERLILSLLLWFDPAKELSVQPNPGVSLSELKELSEQPNPEVFLSELRTCLMKSSNPLDGKQLLDYFKRSWNKTAGNNLEDLD